MLNNSEGVDVSNLFSNDSQRNIFIVIALYYHKIAYLLRRNYYLLSAIQMS